MIKHRITVVEPEVTVYRGYSAYDSDKITCQADLERYIEKISGEYKVGTLITMQPARQAISSLQQVSLITGINKNFSDMLAWQRRQEHPAILRIMQVWPAHGATAWDRTDNIAGYRVVTEAELANLTDMPSDQIQSHCQQLIKKHTAPESPGDAF